MLRLFEWIKDLIPTIEPQHVRDEAYLAEAADVCDLERRMREIDHRGRNCPQRCSLLLGLR